MTFCIWCLTQHHVFKVRPWCSFVRTSFLFVAESHSIQCLGHILLICLSVDGLWSVLTIVGKAACVPSMCLRPVVSFFGSLPRSGPAGLYRSSNFLRNHQTFPFLPAIYEGPNFSIVLADTCCFLFFFFITAIVVGLKQHPLWLHLHSIAGCYQALQPILFMHQLF